LAQTVGSQCNFQNLRYNLQDLIFSCKLLQEKREKGRKAKSQQGCKTMAITGQCIFCMIRELHSAPSVALFA